MKSFKHRERYAEDKGEYIQVPTAPISQTFTFCHMLPFCVFYLILDTFEVPFVGFPDSVPLSPSLKAITVLKLAAILPFTF